jgi:transcriptional regulator with XRE-family HTH domain
LEDVAFLLGWRTSAQLSRYEHFFYMPKLQNVLALAVILQVPVSKLFPKQYEDLQKLIAQRARFFEARRGLRGPQARRTIQRLSLLKGETQTDNNPL